MAWGDASLAAGPITQAIAFDMREYTSPGCRVWAGYERGEIIRRGMRLDALDRHGMRVVLNFPDDTMSIGSTFLNGLVGPAIRSLGADVFRQQYAILPTRFHSTVDDVIRFCSCVHSPLPSVES